MGNYISKINEAVVVFNPLINNGISGVVVFTQLSDRVNININIKGDILKDGLHGFHVHQSGDLREGCDSCCAHYNPTNLSHGGLHNGHSGDLGNILVKNGVCKQILETKKFIIDEIIGRSLIIHEDPDDLGLADTKDSKTTGTSGKRLACSIIGISKNC